MTALNLTGIHHVSAITADAPGNKRFYMDELGMRMIKRTVNQDDPSVYHLFYGDKIGTPGVDLTFFDFPPAGSERRGNHSVTRTGLRVRDEQALGYWRDRFDARGIRHDEIAERDGRQQLVFDDPEGQRLSLVVDDGHGDEPTPWERSPVPAEHQIRGLGPVTMTVPDLRPTDIVLQRVLNMTPVRDYMDLGQTVHVYAMDGEGPHAELHVAVAPDMAPSRPGSGSVHHVAFRTPDEADYHRWAERLSELHIPNSGEVDRYYFRSLYFREPNGVLFEIATDGPGFGVDEDLETLGEKVVLPPMLQPRREAILATLAPID